MYVVLTHALADSSCGRQANNGISGGGRTTHKVAALGRDG
jgi:hypothetical protein